MPHMMPMMWLMMLISSLILLLIIISMLYFLPLPKKIYPHYFYNNYPIKWNWKW